jgi:two-component system chemotaxis response regulator CheY
MARVMIVDDAKIIRMTIKNQLEQLGHEIVASIGNGYDAIIEYKKCKPDLVTMDITMPTVKDVEDGIQALSQILKIDPNANVIMITSHGEQRLVMEAISKGSKGYILKPITKDKFENLLSKMDLQ